jgi:hypothetical protein
MHLIPTSTSKKLSWSVADAGWGQRNGLNNEDLGLELEINL